MNSIFAVYNSTPDVELPIVADANSLVFPKAEPSDEENKEDAKKKIDFDDFAECAACDYAGRDFTGHFRDCHVCPVVTATVLAAAFSRFVIPGDNGYLPFRCSECKFYAYAHDAVFVHVIREHHKIKPYRCEVCDEKFHTEEDTVEHGVVEHYRDLEAGEGKADCDAKCECELEDSENSKEEEEEDYSFKKEEGAMVTETYSPSSFALPTFRVHEENDRSL